LTAGNLRKDDLLSIRPETAADIQAIRQVNLAAFPGPEEAGLVDKLRSSNSILFSFVALMGQEIIGHILFSPVTLEPAGHAVKGAGLAPVAVLPDWQNQGAGSLLIRHGIEQCRKADYDYIALLGHPGYYPRFGFVPSVKYNIRCEYDAPVEAFMILELKAGALSGHSGTIKYLPEFNGV
jgi:putative acetyltransferase